MANQVPAGASEAAASVHSHAQRRHLPASVKQPLRRHSVPAQAPAGRVETDICAGLLALQADAGRAATAANAGAGGDAAAVSFACM